MEKYIALGEKATTFYDPQIKFGLVLGEIKPILPGQLKSPRVRRFLKGGGLTLVGKEEYKEYLASIQIPTKTEEVKVDTEETKDKPERDLTSMTVNQLKDLIKNSGWDSDDIEEGLAKSKKADLIEFIEETELAYE